MLRWRLILEECGTDIQYIEGDKYLLEGALSRFTMNSNQETTQESTNNKVIVVETNYIEEIAEGTFPINFKIINQ